MLPHAFPHHDKLVTFESSKGSYVTHSVILLVFIVRVHDLPWDEKSGLVHHFLKIFRDSHRHDSGLNTLIMVHTDHG